MNIENEIMSEENSLEQILKELRIEEKSEIPSRRRKEEIERVSTGIEDLDRALEGGVPKGTWVVITGEPGTGKSILSMHFAWAGLRNNEPIVYVTTEAEFRDVIKQAKQFGMEFGSYATYNLGSSKEPIGTPQLVVIDIFGLLKTARQLTQESWSSEEMRRRRYAALEIPTLVAAIQEAYRILGVISDHSKSPRKHVRLVIDSMSAFWADRPAMARRYSYELKIATHRENVTALLTSQYAMTTKSLDYEMPIVIKHNNEIRIVKIGEFVNRFFKDGEERIKTINNYYTLSINTQTLKVEWKKIKAVIRHRTSEELYKITTSLGKEIIVTGDHSIYALRGYAIKPVKVSELKKDDLIVIPTNINIPQLNNIELNLAYELWIRGFRNFYITDLPLDVIADKRFDIICRRYAIGNDIRYYWRTKKIAPIAPLVEAFGDEIWDKIRKSKIEIVTNGIPAHSIPNLLRLTPDFFRFLGYVISEGSIEPGDNPVINLYFNINEHDYVEDVINIVRSHFGNISISVYKRNNVLIVKIYSRTLAKVLSIVFNLNKKSREREIPSQVFIAPTDCKIEFLKGLFRGDGSFNKIRGALVYTSCSRQLLNGLLLILLSLGVKSFSIRQKCDRFKTKNPCYDVIISNARDLEKLKDVIKAIGGNTPHRKYYRNTIEILPRNLVIEVIKTITPSKRIRNGSYTHFGKKKYVTKERLIKKLFEAPQLSKLADMLISTDGGGREIRDLSEKLRFLKSFTYGDIGFVKVIKIEKVRPSSAYVYDLSVEDNENFIAGYGWVLAHNSTFGFGLEHIADGVIHLWMDDVERAKEIRRYLIIKKMRMTNHARQAFKLEILPGRGVVLQQLGET